MAVEWIGFLLAMAVIVIGANYNLTLSLLGGSIILGTFTLAPIEIVNQFYVTITTPNTIFLIFALGMIPMIGGILKVSGRLEDIINNLRIGKRPFLGSTPAFIGLLPIPGGALFSAPLIDKAGEGLPGHIKAGINVWFRHIIYFIYPISYALIVASEATELPIFNIVLFQVPFFLFTIILGYVFLLRKADGKMEYDSEIDIHALIPPMAVLLIAPVVWAGLDYGIGIRPRLENLFVLIAVALSFLLAIYLIKDSRKTIMKKAAEEMEPWNFMVLILALYFFFNVFQSSGVGEMIADLAVPGTALLVGFGFLLGFGTGRIMLPSMIIAPVYLSTVGSFSLFAFQAMYTAIFAGYIITPVHPCISISLEYYEGNMAKFLKLMLPMLAISVGTAAVLYVLFG
ncbi:MAG: DUF401 family protein [Candidatus Thermoplasmatota archaeon]|nr:DUF401 family protein [Candidatus Thermoplasmatota archaeon]MBS3790829.1 DUF401 family protein [Candidatus Thermoplasmatota archaeon]